MRIPISILLVSAAVVLAAHTAIAQSDLSDVAENNPIKDKILKPMPRNPMAAIHFFSMDGSIEDSVTGVAASIVKGVSPQDGYVGGAMYFDGENSYVEVPIDVAPNVVGNMTFVAFVRSDDLPDDPDALSAFDTSGYVFTDTGSYIIIGNQKKDSAFFYASSAGALVSDSTQHSVKRGQWQMVALSRRVEDRTTLEGDVIPHTILQLYVDGRVAESVAVFKSGSLAPKMTLGDISDGGTYTYRGGMDQVAIYNRALDKEELDELKGYIVGSRPFFPASSADGVDRENGGDDQSENVPNSRVTKDPIQLPDGNIEREIADIKGGTRGPTPKLSPGDSAAGDDEEQFPGDMFEGEENGQVEESDANSGKTLDDVLPGAGSDGTFDPSGAESIDIDEIRGNALDEMARSQAKIDAGIENSKTADIGTPPPIDPNSTPAINKAAVPADQRATAVPRAATPPAGDATVRQSPPAADDLEKITATREGQDLLKSADWRIVGMVPNSADKPELFPGDEVSVKIRVRKNDPANKIPEVKLVTRAGAGAALQSQKLIINTTTAKPEVTRELPIKITVPSDIEFAASGDQVMWRPTVWLNAKDGKPLQDAVRDNHRFELALAVRRPLTEEECNAQLENSDGTRTNSQCLGLFSRSPKAPNSGVESQFYPKVNIRTFAESDMSSDDTHGGGLVFTESLTFSERGSVLGMIKIGERGDKPCRLAIDDAYFDSHEAGQVSNHCDAENAKGNKDVRSPEGWGIVSMSVCRVGPDNHRIKGIRIVAQRIRADGTLSDETVHKDFERPRCGEWQGESKCNTGYVAAGIISEWENGDWFGSGSGYFNRRDFLTNLGLICAKPLPYSTDQ